MNASTLQKTGKFSPFYGLFFIRKKKSCTTSRLQDITSVTLRDHCHIEVCIYCKHALKVKFSQATSTQNQHWSPLLHVCVNAYASLDAFSSGAPVKIVGQRSHSPHEVVVGRSC